MPITDLTGTKWEFAEDFYTNDSINDTFNIEFTTNGENFSELSLVRISFPGQKPREFTIQIYISYGGNSVYSYESEGGSTTTHSWTNDNYRTIEITGGTDATNSTLIAWLQANATQIQEQSNTFSIGNLPIANMYFGTRQVKKVYMGNTLVWETNLISFTIDGTTYQAESGMTWQTWVNSAYNTDGFWIAGVGISPYNASGYFVALNSVAVQTTDIISNQNYTIIGGGGND